MKSEFRPFEMRRFVDPHVHLWDDVKDWYHLPTPSESLASGLGNIVFPPVFELSDYYDLMTGVDVTKFVHVAAARSADFAYQETRWLDELAQENGAPNAIIGSVDMTNGTAGIERGLDEQMKASRFRGIRLLHGIDYRTEAANSLLEMLGDRKLVYETLGRPDGGIIDTARASARHPDVTFVLNHSGWCWPLDDGLRAQTATWKTEMRELAAQPNVVCKLSGLGIIRHSIDPEMFRSLWDFCIEVFSAERCMFATNFPSELPYGSWDQLRYAFELTASSYTDAEQTALFSGTAERVYRI